MILPYLDWGFLRGFRVVGSLQSQVTVAVYSRSLQSQFTVAVYSRSLQSQFTVAVYICIWQSVIARQESISIL
jgi:hypothetical protein